MSFQGMRVALTRVAVGAILACLVASAGCSGLGTSAPATREWAEGPARWLLLPAEERELAELRNDAEGRLFMDEFWRRRDPQPRVPGNPVFDAFLERVEVADQAYSYEGKRGSLTDRGRALVLLGAPPLIRHGRRNVPAWRPGQRLADRRGSDGSMPVRELVAETWEYGRGDLPPGLLAILDERDEPGISLLFLLEADGSRLVEGEKYLQWAARALVPVQGPVEAKMHEPDDPEPAAGERGNTGADTGAAAAGPT